MRNIWSESAPPLDEGRVPPLDHNRHSSRRERTLEHLLVGELLRHAWRTGLSLEVLKPEVDAGGYDLVLECGAVCRHVQLKASHASASTARVPVHLSLAEKPSGCVVWMIFDKTTLDFEQFLFLGGRPGHQLTGLADCPVVRHSRANAQGVKAERPGLRSVPKGMFEIIPDLAELARRLLGDASTPAGADASPVPAHNETVTAAIPDEQLTLDQIPGPSADWDEIGRFALTCDGYARRTDCGDFANDVAASFDATGKLPPALNLSDARVCLFYEQRRSRQAYGDPTDSDVEYFHALVATIRGTVASR